jgi:hypothetical protein
MKKPNQRIMQNMKDTFGTLGKAAVLIAVATWLGAIAQAATLTVTNTEDSGPGSLRAALAAANDGDTIDATGISGTIILTNGQLLVSNSVTIAGPGANQLTISGNDAQRVLFINPGAPGAASPPSEPFPIVSISGVTLAHGNAQGGAGGTGGGGGGGAAGMGGALFINGGDVTLESVNLSQNVARGGNGGPSGGRYSGGGGGVGGNGTGDGTDGYGQGGSGDGLGGNGGAPHCDGGEGAGGGGGDFSGMIEGNGGNGGFGGGGGGGEDGSEIGSGGNGGFGGGGAGGAFSLYGRAGAGGRGGFFGGGFFGGGGAGNSGSGGGGGAGLGGAIFIRMGSLSLCTSVLSSNSAFHGLGGPGRTGGFAGTNGLAKGGAIFVYTGALAQTDSATTFTSNAADDDAGGTTDTADVFGVLSPPAPPNITCPSNIVTQPDPGKCTATVMFAPVATGSCALTTVCTPPSGTAFPIGTNTVNCKATDTSSNSVSGSFTITVVGSTAPPTITCPSNIVTQPDPGKLTATVTFAPLATGSCVTTVCTPPSGSAFHIGTNTVNCTATDTWSNSVSCSFTITVAALPTITCPSNIVTQPDPGKLTATVTFAPVATGSGVTTVCTPPSGSAFPIGTNTVDCTATDMWNNAVHCSFTIMVTAGNRCPLGTGFWKTHSSLWPVSQLTLGSITYNKTQLLSILNNPTTADASVILASQLIATLLDTANGSNPVPIASTVADANRLLGGARIPCNVKTTTATGKAMLSDAKLLNIYNLGSMTPGCTP